MFEAGFPWMHEGRPPVSVGVDGYPVFPGDPQLEIHLALGECLESIGQLSIAVDRRRQPAVPPVAEPLHTESIRDIYESFRDSYREQRRAEGAVLRAFLDRHAHEWPALFHATLDRVLWLNSCDYAWVSSCEAMESARRVLYEPFHNMQAVLVHFPVDLPEGETPVWVNTLKYQGTSIHSFTSDRPCHGRDKDHHPRRILNNLLARRVAWSAGDIARMLEAIASERVWDWMLRAPAVLRVVARHIEEHGMNGEVRDLLGRVRDKHRSRWAPAKRIVARVDRILGEAPEPELLEPGERWADAARADLEAMSGPEREAWTELLRHAGAGKAAGPSGRWAARAKKHLESVGADRFVEHVARWFALVGQPGAGPPRGSPVWVRDATLICERSAGLLCGLVRCCAQVDDRRAGRAVAGLAESCFHKVPGIGARSGRVGNACLAALGEMAGPEPVAWLVRLASRVKYARARSRIEVILAGAAARARITAEDLEETSVPDLGLEDGCLRRAVGDHAAEARFAGSGRLVLRWLRPDGTAQKTVPAEVRRLHAVALNDFKREISDVERLLAAQCDRVERLLTAGRTWPLDVWRERYLDHPLMFNLARRLVWRFHLGNGSRLGCWREGRLVDDQDRPLENRGGSTTVSLWHPIESQPDEVLRWRVWLESREITQPFKQAHREIYLLTDAERATRSYSNRFAAHLLRQHQLAALCRQKGWRYTLQGDFDSDNAPTLSLPRWGLRGEFRVENPAHRGPLSPSGISLYVTTDRVCVYWADAHEPIPLEEVPPLAFSELMRDVDLFVGIASIAANPEWRDRGEAGEHDDEAGEHLTYWDRQAFGELAAPDRTRREVLARLIPRLKIASRCTLTDRFLVVRGDLRTYRIHLGSGNILMEPNNQYLCIVPARTRWSPWSDEIFLPFEGDPTLSVILSKALLLAEDRKIRDETIRRQIGPASSDP